MKSLDLEKGNLHFEKGNLHEIVRSSDLDHSRGPRPPKLLMMLYWRCLEILNLAHQLHLGANQTKMQNYEITKTHVAL